MKKIELIFDRRKQSSATQKGQVDLMIYFSRTQRKIINTKISCYPKQWRKGRIWCIGCDAMNTRLKELIAKYTRIVEAMEVLNEPMTIEAFNRHLDKPKRRERKKQEHPDILSEKDTGSFLDFMEDEIHNSPDMRYTTKKQHIVPLEALKRFGRIRRFSDLTLQNIMLFDRFLRREGIQRSQPTIHNYHKTIKKYVALAYRLGLIPENPYLRFEDPRGRTRERQALTAEELNLMRTAELPARYDRVRDLFIFQSYTGLAYSDLRGFKPEKVESHGGQLYISGQRYKTGVRFFTPLLPPAKAILDKYHNRLPVISNVKYNLYLHDIEDFLHLRKSITSHVARHTFATTVTLANNVPIECVSKMLGHTNIKTTQIYAKILDSQIEHSVADLIDKIQ